MGSASPVGFNAAAAGASTSGAAGRARLEPAYLQTYEPSRNGSLSEPGAPRDRIKFQFNPKELTIEKGASWSRQNAQGNQSSSPPQYTGPQPSKLSLEMFFDASDKHDTSVVRNVEKLFECCTPTSSTLQQNRSNPPWVVFRWGGLTGFLAYISKVSAKYTLFTSAGVPIRAVCTVTLEELSGEAPRQNPTSGTPVPHRVHQVVLGDSLPAIAYGEYGDPGLWRAVARLNGVDDPMRLRAGDQLLLPSVDDLEIADPGPAQLEAKEPVDARR